MNLQINKKNTIYFIGIGGIGMSGIALIMKNLGYNVKGSDLSKKSKILDQLKKKKINVVWGHETKAILKADMIVVSTAINFKNKEYQLAKKNKIPIVKRADMLAHLINLKKNIIISGSHGKTTITSLVSHLLKDNKFYPMIVNGGIINSLNSNATVGKGQWSVVEADESDGSFLKFKSIYSVVSNIDKEHMDYYKSFKNLNKYLKKFLNKKTLLLKNILFIEYKNIKKIIKKNKNKNYLTYGFSKKANLQCKNVKNINMGMKFDIYVNLPNKKKIIKDVNIKLMGIHNVLNATATFGVGLLLNIKIEKIIKSLFSFSGVQRRLTLIYQKNKSLIYDDYAHHPTEIQAVLKACKNNFNKKKIIAIFQPHRYSRLLSLYNNFTKSFSYADRVLICPVYSAGEKNKNFKFNKFCKDILTNSSVEVVQVNSKDEIELYLKKNMINNVIVAMGAGSISSWIRDISKKFNR
ncbi:MAG: UDP-N-acetylmuramate--L-alanine ligase [Pelagibacteraceae bacterium]